MLLEDMASDDNGSVGATPSTQPGKLVRLLDMIWTHSFMLASMLVFWALSDTVLQSAALRILAMVLFGVIVFNIFRIVKWIFGGFLMWLAWSPVSAILIGGLVGTATPVVPLLFVLVGILGALWVMWQLISGWVRVCVYLEANQMHGVFSKRLRRLRHFLRPDGTDAIPIQQQSPQPSVAATTAVATTTTTTTTSSVAKVG